MKRNKAHSVYLFTNRNCMVFDVKGEQIPRYQRGISCYTLDKTIARKVASEAKEFNISRFREWCHPISRKEFEYMLGLRTRRMDLADLKRPPTSRGGTR